MTQTNTNNRKTIADRVVKWLDEYGFTYRIILLPNLFMYLKVEVGKDRFIHITIDDKEYSLSIFTVIDLFDIDKKVFSSLNERERNEFISTLSSALSNINIYHTVQEKNSEKAKYLNIEQAISFDDLTKNDLYFTIDKIYNDAGIVNLIYSKYLPKRKKVE